MRTATHSRTLPGEYTGEEPGRLQSMGSQGATFTSLHVQNRGFPSGSSVKNLPAMKETQV